MALDTAQQRGSAVGVSLPWRSWAAVPTGTISYGERLSIAYYVSPGELVGGFTCGSITVSAVLDGNVAIAALVDGVSSVETILMGQVGVKRCG